MSLEKEMKQPSINFNLDDEEWEVVQAAYKTAYDKKCLELSHSTTELTEFIESAEFTESVFIKEYILHNLKNNKFGKRKKKNVLDKFYTKPEVSKRLIEKTLDLYDVKDYDVILEPSAGSGSFLLNLPPSKRMGLDIKPDHEEIEKIDFLEEWNPKKGKKYLVIGNPPFGRGSSLAVKFFEKSAEFADVIAFLIPRTFRRVSIQNKLNLNFHLVYDEEMPLNPCCFVPKMGAKCCFQIWERRDYKREKVILSKESEDWEFLPMGPLDENKQPTPPVDASFALRAYGSNCGEVVTEGLDKLRPKSWHWIKTENPKKLIDRFSKLNYSISKDTARQDSLGRAELVWLYNERHKK